MPSWGRLTIATRTKKDKAVISFSDTGCGIEENQLTKVFDPFIPQRRTVPALGLPSHTGLLKTTRVYICGQHSGKRDDIYHRVAYY